MNTELTLNTFIDIKNISICNQDGYKDNVKTLKKLGLSSNLPIANCNSVSSASNVMNTSSPINLSSTSLSISSISSFSSSIINQTISVSQSKSNTSTSSKTSFLDILFGSVKASAVGAVVYDYRFPYPNGTNISTMRVFDDGTSTHTGHNAVDFWSLTNINNDIVAARAGKVVVSSGDPLYIGNHIVVLQDDGNYALYGHLSSRVAVNTVLKRGEYLGKQGKTGGADDYEHLHFEVLQLSILNFYNGLSSNCTGGFNNNYCYTDGFTLDQYKVYPAYDECWVVTGGTQNNENNCRNSANTGNKGYLWRYQSYPLYWTSINSAPVIGPTRPQIFNNQPGTIDLRNNPDTWSLDVQNYGDLNGNGTYDQTQVNMIKRTTGPNNAQKWQYYPNTKQIVGMNDYCLDSGGGSDGDYLRIIQCSNGNGN